MSGNSISANRVASATTTSNTVDTVVITDPCFGIQVQNTTGNSPLWFTVSQRGGACPVPTVGASVGVFCAASVAGTSINVRHEGQFGSIVQLISAAPTTYTVSAIGNQANA